MAILGYDRISFGKKVNEVVSPSHPILLLEHLKGRTEQLGRIQKALFITGRNIFIYGERGVGKSSLAATAASQWCQNSGPYIDISCAPDTTVLSMIANLTTQALHQSRIQKSKIQTSYGIGIYKWISWNKTSEQEYLDFKNEIKTLSDGIETLKELVSLFENPLVVVVDEVDRIKDEKEIEKFADFLKQIGDKRVDIKFIFTGIGRTLDEILGSHRSAIRQLETIELPKLSWNARWDIAIEALKAFNIKIDEDIYIRIAMISDGYPYYVHLIIEKLLWILFEKPNQVVEVLWEDYSLAVEHAINTTSAELSRPYEKAINQRSNDYEEIVWSTIIAENNIGEYIGKMYELYETIMQQKPESTMLDSTKFANRVRNLLKEEYGCILIKGLKSGQYMYREKMLRGYVRLRAEQQKIELGVSAKENPELKNKMLATVRSNRYYPSRPPRNFR